MKIQIGLIFFVFILASFVNVEAFASNPICRLLSEPRPKSAASFRAADELDRTKDQKALDIAFDWLSNETDIFLFRGSLRRGGGLVGVGADQVLSLGAMAKSAAVWIYDMNPNALQVAQRLTALSKEAPTLPAFIQLLGDRYKTLDPKFVEFVTKIAERRDDSGVPFGVLGEEASYQWLRQLALTDKIRFVLGNHFDPVVFQEIGRDAKDLGVSILNVYLSNTLETRWMRKHEAGEPGGIGFAMSYMMQSGSLFEAERQKIEIALARGDMAALENETSLLGIAETFSLHFMGLMQGRAPFFEMWPVFRNNFRTLHVSPQARVFVSSVEHDPLVRLPQGGHTILDVRTAQIFKSADGKVIRWTYAFAPAGIYVAAHPTRLILNLYAHVKKEAEGTRDFFDRWSQAVQNPEIRKALIDIRTQLDGAIEALNRK